MSPLPGTVTSPAFGINRASLSSCATLCKGPPVFVLGSPSAPGSPAIVVVSTCDLQLNEAIHIRRHLRFAALCREVVSIPAFQAGKLSLERLRARLRVIRLRTGPGLAWVCLAPKGNGGGKEPTALKCPERKGPIHHGPLSPETQRGDHLDAAGDLDTSSFTEGTH